MYNSDKIEKECKSLWRVYERNKNQLVSNTIKY